jgi:hypothetical protein
LATWRHPQTKLLKSMDQKLEYIGHFIFFQSLCMV